MKINVFLKALNVAGIIWDKLTRKEPMTKWDVIGTSIITVVVWLLFQFGGLTFGEIEQGAQTVSEVKATLGG